MAIFRVKEKEKGSSKGKVITWNKPSDFMAIELNGKEEVVHTYLAEKLIKRGKAKALKSEIVDTRKEHEKKLEKRNTSKK